MFNKRTAAIALALLAACSGPGQQPMRAVPQTPSVASGDNLLYVTNWLTGYVSILTYPQGVPVGSIGGFEKPEAECVDASGNVYVADALHHQIQKFGHGGTTPVKKLPYTGGEPFACSVDPLSGSLAVTNGSRSKKQTSVVAIFTKDGGQPRTYALKGFYASYCGYDDQGNLYLDGVIAGGHAFAFAELPKGADTIGRVPLNVAIHYPGSIQWDGKYLMVSDQFPPAAYRFTFTQSGGTKVGSPTLFAGLYEAAQFWLYKGEIVGVGSDGNVYVWNYPKGGDPLETYVGFSDPAGAVVSPAR